MNVMQKLTIGVLLSGVCSLTLAAASLIDQKRMEAIQVDRSGNYIHGEKQPAIKVGRGQCATGVTFVMQSAQGLMLDIDPPKQCGFRKIELLINGDVLPLTALNDQFKQRPSGAYAWQRPGTSGAMFFATSTQYTAEQIRGLKLHEPLCPKGDPDCLSSPVQGGDNLPGAAIEPTTSSTVAYAKTDPASAQTTELPSKQRGTVAAGDSDKYTTVEYTKDGKTETCRFFDGFADNKDGTVTDPRDSAVWMRCPLGTQWDGQVCQGEAKKYSWFAAMEAAKKHDFAGHKDWRIGSRKEFQAATVGESGSCFFPEDGRIAASSMLVPASNPADSYQRSWTSDTNIETENSKTYRTRTSDGYMFSLKSGYDNDESLSSSFNWVEPVRLVRAGRSEAVQLFEKQYANLGMHKSQLNTNDAINAEVQRSNTQDELKKCQENNFEGENCTSLKRQQTWLYKLSTKHVVVQEVLALGIILTLAVGVPWVLMRRQLFIHRWLPQKWWARLPQLLALLLVCWLLGGIAAFNSNDEGCRDCVVSYTAGYSDALGNMAFMLVAYGAIFMAPYLGCVYLVRWLWRKFFKKGVLSTQ